MILEVVFSPPGTGLTHIHLEVIPQLILGKYQLKVLRKQGYRREDIEIRIILIEIRLFVWNSNRFTIQLLLCFLDERLRFLDQACNENICFPALVKVQKG